jgi:hypothetical protein
VPLRLADLSSEERQQLPALKVSMHMWAPAAGDRFAIIDGTRVNEGDRLGDATVESIQNDGVMLAWRGAPPALADPLNPAGNRLNPAPAPSDCRQHRRQAGSRS